MRRKKRKPRIPFEEKRMKIIKRKRIKKIVLYTILSIFLVLLLNEIIYGRLFSYPKCTFSDFPDTHWRSDELGLDIYVDTKGDIIGYSDLTSGESFHVVSHPTGRGESNCTLFFTQDAHPDCALIITCIYRRADHGKIFCHVLDWDKTIINQNVVIRSRFQKKYFVFTLVT